MENLLAQCAPIKDEIKTEPADDYEEGYGEDQASHSYIYDPEDVKMEVNDESFVDVKEEIVDYQTLGQSVPLTIGSTKEEYPDEPSTSYSAVSANNDDLDIKTAVICSECGELFKFQSQLDLHISLCVFKKQIPDLSRSIKRPSILVKRINQEHISPTCSSINNPPIRVHASIRSQQPIRVYSSMRATQPNHVHSSIRAPQEHVSYQSRVIKKTPIIQMKDATEEQSCRGHTKLDGCFYVEKAYHKQNRHLFPLEPETSLPSQTLDCGVCGEQFTNAREHRIHAIKIHPENEEERMCKNTYCVRMRKVHKPFNLGDGILTPAKRELLAPMYDTIPCPICKETKKNRAVYDNYFHLHSHYKQKHAMDHTMRFVCKGCDRVYTSPKGLKNHIIDETKKHKDCCGQASIQTAQRRKRVTDIVLTEFDES